MVRDIELHLWKAAPAVPGDCEDAAALKSSCHLLHADAAFVSALPLAA